MTASAPAARRDTSAPHHAGDGLGGLQRSRSTRSVIGRFSSGHVFVAVAGLLAAALTFAALNAAKDTVGVVVAAEDLEPGAALAADVVTTAEINAGDDVIATLIEADDIDAFLGEIVTSRVSRGALVTRGSLKSPSAAATDSRAMSLAVDPAHAAGGAIEAGDRVDVIGPGAGGADFVATHLEVLSVEDTGGGITNGPSALAITVAVSPETALALANAIGGDGGIEVLRATGASAIDRPTSDVETATGGG